MTNELIHLFSFDPRFCGVEGTHRVTVEDKDVTCPDCRVPDCDLCGQPMMLQEAISDEDALEQIKCGSPYPQWVCFCNSGHYQALAYSPSPAHIASTI